MAYDFFPKSDVEISQHLQTADARKTGDIITLFKYLKKETRLESPINIDKQKLGIVNVSRAIDGTLSLDQIKRNTGISSVNIKFGNGSSGNRGVNNRGNLFEPQFADALLAWWKGETVSNREMLDAIEHLDKTYNLRKGKKLKIDVVGGENTKRPLVFSPDIMLTNPKGTGNNVGPSVTDITLTLDGKEIYLSLKLGTTVTFFNVGIRTVLTPEEIKSYSIKNPNGKKLLKLFGIDEKLFCDVFNGRLERGMSKVSNVDRAKMQKLLKSGIGEGYHIIHKLTGRILSKKMDTAALEKAARVNNATIYYGGKTGTGKRVDIEMESETYRFKLNMRDTQGKDGYPTRLMCDFSYK